MLKFFLQNLIDNCLGGGFCSVNFEYTHTETVYTHGSSPPNFKGDLKISDQNNWRGSEQNIKFGGGPKMLRGGGHMNIVGKGGHTPPTFS